MKYRPFLLLILVGVCLYGASLSFGFLTWDDDIHITANDWVLSGQWLKIWTTPYYGFYIPLTYSVWSLLSSITIAPWAFHLLNVLLHILNTIFVYILIAEVLPRKGARDFAIWGALLFCVHPLQVETVAWVSGTRDLLSAALALLALILHLRRKNAVLALLVFALGLLAKPSIAVLPLVALVLDPRFGQSRFSKFCWFRLTPWFGLALVIPWFTLSYQAHLGITQTVEWWQRPWIAVDALGFYAGKILCPFPLAVDYGRTPAVVLQSGFFYGSMGALALLLFLTFWFGVSFYLLLSFLLLLPVLGFVPFAFQYVSTVADHYMYLPMLGVALIMARANHDLRGRARWVLLVAVLLACAGLSGARLFTWRNDAVFYADMIEKNPRSFQAYLSLAELEKRQGQYEFAIGHYLRALELSPVNGPAQVGLAMSLTLAGRDGEVVRFLGPRLGAKPPEINGENQNYYAQLYYFLGRAQMNLQDLPAAKTNLCLALRLDRQNEKLKATLLKLDPQADCAPF